MKLSKSQFEKFLEENRLILSFIGMSNIGKTYWSKKLQDLGFRHINCDDLIEKKLTPVLKELEYSGIEDVSRWMGQPYEEKFFANQHKYVSFEKEVMEEIFSEIKNINNRNIIIDTTGSVVHTGKNITEKLKQYSMVIYIAGSEDMKEEMFKKYMEKPKPVVFGDVYNQEQSGTQLQALSRCYRKLLNLRSALYAQCADVVIPREAIVNDITVSQFISLIKHAI
ncbi:MAG: hypothetical protein HYV33_00715 [Candidatus Kerfeldbacteria bacterium]|nr:hypothetical protein [Candidatus Kerfeldbacteria bacterium]